MADTTRPVRKVTISLPEELLVFADAQAQAQATSRSRYIAELIDAARARQEEELAAEGYGFYAEESRAFAEASGPAFAETLVEDTVDER